MQEMLKKKIFFYQKEYYFKIDTSILQNIL